MNSEEYKRCRASGGPCPGVSISAWVGRLVIDGVGCLMADDAFRFLQLSFVSIASASEKHTFLCATFNLRKKKTSM